MIIDFEKSFVVILGIEDLLDEEVGGVVVVF